MLIMNLIKKCKKFTKKSYRPKTLAHSTVKKVKTPIFLLLFH
jgi:hypothetical protein